MNRFVFSPIAFALLSTLTFACGSSGTSNGASGGAGGGDDDAATNLPARTLAYTSPCAPASCDDSPTGDSSGVATCSAGSEGTCGWSPGAPGQPPSGSVPGSPGSPPTTTSPDPGTTTSYASCDPGACGSVIPAIACASGYDEGTPQCGSLNGGPCVYTIECTPHDTGVACTAPDACGEAIPDLARVCDAGTSSTPVCTQTAAGCEWEFECE